MRYYYKNKNGNGYLNLKSPVDNPDYIEISEDEFNEATKPKEPTKAERENLRRQIRELEAD